MTPSSTSSSTATMETKVLLYFATKLTAVSTRMQGILTAGVTIEKAVIPNSRFRQVVAVSCGQRSISLPGEDYSLYLHLGSRLIPTEVLKFQRGSRYPLEGTEHRIIPDSWTFENVLDAGKVNLGQGERIQVVLVAKSRARSSSPVSPSAKRLKSRTTGLEDVANLKGILINRSEGLKSPPSIRMPTKANSASLGQFIARDGSALIDNTGLLLRGLSSSERSMTVFRGSLDSGKTTCLRTAQCYLDESRKMMPNSTTSFNAIFPRSAISQSSDAAAPQPHSFVCLFMEFKPMDGGPFDSRSVQDDLNRCVRNHKLKLGLRRPPADVAGLLDSILKACQTARRPVVVLGDDIDIPLWELLQSVLIDGKDHHESFATFRDHFDQIQEILKVTARGLEEGIVKHALFTETLATVPPRTHNNIPWHEIPLADLPFTEEVFQNLVTIGQLEVPTIKKGIIPSWHDFLRPRSSPGGSLPFGLTTRYINTLSKTISATGDQVDKEKAWKSLRVFLHHPDNHTIYPTQRLDILVGLFHEMYALHCDAEDVSRSDRTRKQEYLNTTNAFALTVEQHDEIQNMYIYPSLVEGGLTKEVIFAILHRDGVLRPRQHPMTAGKASRYAYHLTYSNKLLQDTIRIERTPFCYPRSEIDFVAFNKRYEQEMLRLFLEEKGFSCEAAMQDWMMQLFAKHERRVKAAQEVETLYRKRETKVGGEADWFGYIDSLLIPPCATFGGILYVVELKFVSLYALYWGDKGYPPQDTATLLEFSRELFLRSVTKEELLKMFFRYKSEEGPFRIAERKYDKAKDQLNRYIPGIAGGRYVYDEKHPPTQAMNQCIDHRVTVRTDVSENESHRGVRGVIVINAGNVKVQTWKGDKLIPLKGKMQFSIDSQGKPSPCTKTQRERRGPKPGEYPEGKPMVEPIRVWIPRTSAN
ncbi:hypothetical protein AAF712_011594 [Marasmius tenuissimus]|uniref:Uncharacterized protein n=1 Tax=Marasmius tenuissimus TaxID=585030 RepID=A0ABR2ZJL2_9AGAR